MLNNGSSSNLKDFETLAKLGQGSFGEVFKVKRRIDSNIYVMKQINISKMNSRMKQDAINEVNILSKMDNPYVVKYYDSFIDKHLLCIVMEYCDSGDLSTYLKSQFGRPLQEVKIWKFFILSCMGLDYIHRKKILHRDIKAMNIFLTKDDSLRIGDLGVAKVLSDQGNFAHTMVGTPFYLSPEMCEEKPYNEKSDIWSLGCVLYELCTYRHPFEANNQGALVLRIIRGKYNPIPSNYSKDLVTMVDMILCRDYKKRPNAREILQTQIVKQKASSLNIELDYTKVKNKEITYLQKKDDAPPAQSVAATPLQNKNIIDKPKDKVNGFINPSNHAAKIISKSPSSQNVEISQLKAKNDLFKKMQLDEKELNKKSEQKLNQQGISNIQKDDKNNKEKMNELNKKEEQLKQQKQEQLKPTEQMFNMQKKREEMIKKMEERKQMEKKKIDEFVKKEAERKKEEEEQRKKKEQEKQKQESSHQQLKQKDDQLKNDFKIKQNGFDLRQNNYISQPQLKVEKTSPQQLESKKQLFGNQMPENFNQIPQTRVSQNQIQFGYVKQKKEVPEKKEIEKPKDPERKNVQRIRKGAPTALGYNAKNPYTYIQKDVKQTKEKQSDLQSELDQDREEVLNLPDNVHIKRNVPKSAQPYRPTVNDLRSIASMGENQNNSNILPQRRESLLSNQQRSQHDKRILDQKNVIKPEQGKLLSVESFDSSFENSPNKDEKDEQNSSEENQHPKSNSEERLHYNKPFVSKDITEQYQNKKIKNVQQVVNDSFIDQEFGSSDNDEDKDPDQKQTKSNKYQNNNDSKNSLEDTQFEYITVPKLKQLASWQKDKTEIKESESVDEQNNLSESSEEESDNNLGTEYFKSQTINRNLLDLPDDMDIDDEFDEENKQYYENQEKEDQYYYDEEGNNEEDECDENQEIRSISDQDWQKDEEEEDSQNNFDDQTEDDQQDQSTQDEIQQSSDDKKRNDLNLKIQAQLKRQGELQILFNIKVQECHKVLGEAKFNMILSFFKNKLNSDQELTDEDQDEIDQMIQDNMKNISNMQVVHNFYKILHLEVELEKCKVNIKNLEQNINSL